MSTIKKRKILVITSTYDKTVDMIISRFSSLVEFFRFDVDNMLAYDITVSADFFSIKSGGSSINSDCCKSIYYRKPSNSQIQKLFNSPYDQFATKELFALVEGIAEIFDGRCLTRPSVMKLANNKVYQGKVAKLCGFNQPISVITNSLSNISLINDECIIVKPLAVGTIVFPTHKEYVQTNLYNPDYDSEALTYSPAYFQKYQNKDFEVRLTVIDGSFFAVKIQSTNLIDWRRSGAENTYQYIDTPDPIKNQCSEYMAKMNMHFGCFDFIVYENEWFFLEMNVNGQWAWLEEVAGIDIGSKIMGYLNA